MTAESNRAANNLKFDWLTAIRSDPRVNDAAYKFASYVAHRLHVAKGTTYFGDDAAGDELNMSRSKLGLCRKVLRELGYLSFASGRGRRATQYMPLYDRVSDMLDVLIQKREARIEARDRRQEQRTNDLRNASKRRQADNSNASNPQHKNTANASNPQRPMRHF